MASGRLAGENPVVEKMRAVLQRVSDARVTIDGSVAGEITTGLLILLGVGRDDTSAVAAGLAERIANLRIFEDDQRKMNRSLLDVKGSALVVSQFTLYGDARGNGDRALLPLRRLNKQRICTKNLRTRSAEWESPSRQELSAR